MVRLPLRRVARAALIVAAGTIPAGGFAADPQPYGVTLQTTGQGPEMASP